MEEMLQMMKGSGHSTTSRTDSNVEGVTERIIVVVVVFLCNKSRSAW
jgi:hypothetical protein